MRILAIILGSAAVGAAIGAAAAVVVYNTDPEMPIQLASKKSAKAPTRIAAGPRVEIAEPVFNYGKMQRGTTNSHEFVVANIGTAPLTLKVGDTTCKCTLGVATDEPIAPGESVPVKVEWTANSPPGHFRQTATLLTNDPLKSRVLLIIEGEISAAEGVEPSEFMFDKVSAGESKSTQVFVMSMLEDEITVENAELVHPETREFFDLQVEPVPREQLPNAEAKAGVRLTLTLKPGMPIGSFTQRVTLRTSFRDAPTLDIPAVGRVVGDISVHGTSWDDERGVLRLGRVESSVGKTARLNLVVRGLGAPDVQFSVASLDPPDLRATLGEPRRLSDTLVHVTLEVAVPPGTPPMVRLGTDQGKDGRVMLSTTHPNVKELAVGVRFSVER